MLIYTSGTTGSPKGALHGHKVLLGHIPGVQMHHDFLPQPGDRIWTPADWAWAGGLLNVLLPALKLGVPVVSKYTGSWADAQMAARDGTADIIFGIYFNDERATYLDYVQPAFMLDPVVAMVATGKNFPFTGQDDLIGKKGVTNNGESYGPALDAFIADKLTMTRTSGVDKAFNAVISGEADYMIAGLYPSITAAAQFRVTGQLDPLDPPLLTADMFIAFSKKSPCLGLIEPFSKAITAMTADGTYATALKEAITTWTTWIAKNQ